MDFGGDFDKDEEEEIKEALESEVYNTHERNHTEMLSHSSKSLSTFFLLGFTSHTTDFKRLNVMEDMIESGNHTQLFGKNESKKSPAKSSRKPKLN